MTRQRVAAVRRHIEATLGPGDQLLLSTRMVSTSNAFEVRGEGEVATFPISISVVKVSLCRCWWRGGWFTLGVAGTGWWTPRPRSPTS